MKALRSAYPRSLLVDTGWSIMGTGAARDVRDDGLIARVYRDLGYDALNAGNGELTAGPSALSELRDGRPPLLSVNGVLTAAGAPPDLLKPYVVKKVAGLRVALVGVTAGGPASNGDAAVRLPPGEALRAILPDARKQADLVVVLADLDVSGIRILAEEGLDVDVLLGARASVGREAAQVGRTVVASAGGFGRYAGRLTLRVSGDGQIAGFESEELPLDTAVAEDQAVLSLRRSY